MSARPLLQTRLPALYHTAGCHPQYPSIRVHMTADAFIHISLCCVWLCEFCWGSDLPIPKYPTFPYLVYKAEGNLETITSASLILPASMAVKEFFCLPPLRGHRKSSFQRGPAFPGRPGRITTKQSAEFSQFISSRLYPLVLLSYFCTTVN